MNLHTGILQPLVPLMVVFAAVFAGSGAIAFRTSMAESTRTQQQLVEAQQYAQTILRYRDAPDKIADEEIETTLLARLIEEAAEKSGVGAASLERIWPQAPRRVGDSAYLRKGTQLILREATLANTVNFLNLLEASETPLSIDALRMNPGRNPQHKALSGSAATETWTFELTVSYLIYRPVGTGSPA